MSLKNVRKLLNETNDISEEIDDDSIQGPVIKSRKKKKAISALFLVEEDEEIDTRDSDDTDEYFDPQSIKPVEPKEKQLKKRKKVVDESESDHGSAEEDVDIEAAIEEVNKILGPPDDHKSKSDRRGRYQNILRVINRNLNFEEEYKCIKSAQELSLAVVESSKQIKPMIPGQSMDSLRKPMVPGQSMNSLRKPMVPGQSMNSLRKPMVPGQNMNSFRDPRTGRFKLQASSRRTNLIAKDWLLVNPRRHQSVPNLGLSMEVDSSIQNVSNSKVSSSKVSNSEASNSEVHFVIKHSTKYQEVHVEFLHLIKRNDIEELVSLMNEHPNHVESLINAASLINDQDLNLSFQLIERSLLCYENIFPSKFNLSANECKLSYKKPENRSFFVTLFKFMILSARFGCYKTALEVSKLILNLDTIDDPLSVLMVIDHFSIKAKNYDFLIDLYNCSKNSDLKSDLRQESSKKASRAQKWRAPSNLDKLPNFVFNTALAHLLKSLDKAPKIIPDGDVSKMASNPKVSNLDERQKFFNQSNELLQEGLLLFPSVLRTLLDTIGVEPDVGVKKCSYFAIDTTTTCPLDQSPFMHDLIELFVERNSTLWKECPNLLLWLETNVNIVINRLKSDPTIVSKYQNLRYKYYPLESVTPRNVFRHVYLSGMKKVKIPKDVLIVSNVSNGGQSVTRSTTQSGIGGSSINDQILPFDPIPPIDTLEYETNVVIGNDEGASGNVEGAIGGIFSSFVKSWLPSFNPTERKASSVPRTVKIVTRDRRHGNKGRMKEKDGNGTETTRTTEEEKEESSGVASVMTAVKDLLNGFSLGDEGGEMDG